MANLNANGKVIYKSNSVEQDPYNYTVLTFLNCSLEPRDGYVVSDQLMIEMANYGNLRSDYLYEVFGKVIYERLIGYSSFQIDDARFVGGKRNVAEIGFNWKIESQIPPTGLLSNSTDNYQPWEWGNQIWRNGQNGWGGYFNALIGNVIIRIRKLVGNRSTDGGWLGPGINSATDKMYANPFDSSSYVEVGKIRVSAKLINMPPEATLNDTNRGYDSKLRPHLAVEAKSKLLGLSGQLYGYNDATISINTATNQVLFIKDGTFAAPEDTRDLSIEWNAGFAGFDDDTYYYLTLEPENHPVNRVNDNNKKNYNPQFTPSDGWYGIEKIWPFNYGGPKAPSMFDGVDEPFSLDPWKMIKRFDGLNETKQESWAGEGGVWKNPKDILSKLRNSSLKYSNTDELIPSEEFHMYGFNIQGFGGEKATYINNYSNKLVKYSDRDDLDAKAEYFAWFKTPKNTLKPFTSWDKKNDIKHTPQIFNVDATTVTSGVTYTAKVKASFYYSVTFDKNGKKVLKSDGNEYGIDAYLKEDFGPPFYPNKYYENPTDWEKIKAQYFVEKSGVLYGRPKRKGDLATQAGFRFRRAGSTVWGKPVVIEDGLQYRIDEYVRVRPSMVADSFSGADQDFYSKDLTTNFVQVTFETSVTDPINGSSTLDLDMRYEYQIWVKTAEGITYYSGGANNPSALVDKAQIYTVSAKDVSLASFLPPAPNIFGHWYQIYDAWHMPKKDTGFVNVSGAPALKPDDSRLFSPYITVREALPESLIQNVGGQKVYPPNPYPYNDSAFERLLPVHYYLSKTFSQDKVYTTRVVLENFYGGERPYEPSKSNFENQTLQNNIDRDLFVMQMPWSEKYRFRKFDIRLPSKLDLTGRGNLGPQGSFTSQAAINIYLTSNINAFTSKFDTPAKPISKIVSTTNPQNPMTFWATYQFSKSSLAYFDIYESDWLLQGQATWNMMPQVSKGQVQPVGTQIVPWFDQNKQPVGGKGWHFITSEKKLIWFDAVPLKADGSTTITNWKMLINSNLPAGGDVTDFFSNKTAITPKYLLNNFAAKFIPYQTFNVSFKYQINNRFETTMYLGSQLPKIKSDQEWWITDIDELISKGYVKKVAALTKELFSNKSFTAGKTYTENCEFIGLVGNQYLFFVVTPIIRHYEGSGTDDDPYVQDSYNFGDKSFVPEIPGIQNINPFTGKVDGGVKYTGDMFFHTRDTNGFNISTDAFGSEIYGGFGAYQVTCLYDFKFQGAYNELNNSLFETPKNNFKIDNSLANSLIQGAGYSLQVGVGNNVIAGSPNTSITLYSKAGSGTFVSGIWENGVWNNGWRDDRTMREFFDVESFYTYDYNTRCRIKIRGNKESVDSFSVGDYVAIGNIVAIDQNDKRKLLRNFYTIVDKSASWIEVDMSYEFSLMRIERDSLEHRIVVTKNIWLNGVFFNGNFKGVWNNGLFSGYPKITKMEKAQWIDGIFNGGHFLAKKLKLELKSIAERAFQNYPRMAVTTKTKHTLDVGDIISITYLLEDGEEGTFGTTKIIEILDDFTFTSSTTWQADLTALSGLVVGGSVYTVISDGLIQNFYFYSNNVSKYTSIQSLNSQTVFSYNSWIDVNYSNQTAVNIGRPENYNEESTKRSYSENNLFGYPTNDVLSSQSIFRDSFSLDSRKYRLGKRFKIVSDFVGQSSTFEDYFDPTDSAVGPELFNKLGWDFAVSPDYTLQIISITSSLSGGSQSISHPSYLTLTLPETEVTTKFEVGASFSIIGPWTWFAPFPNQPNLVVPQFSINTGFVTVTANNKVPKGREIVTDQKIIVYDDNLNSILDKMTGFDKGRWETDLTLLSPGWPAEQRDYKIYTQTKNYVAFSRTNEPTSPESKLKGKELRVDTVTKGGILNLIPADDVIGRTNTDTLNTINKRRYSMVEFDIVDVNTATASTKFFVDPILGKVPPLHFNNLNITTRQKDLGGVKVDVKSIATYHPVYKNINHLTTLGIKKQEFFFNKRNLLMNFWGLGENGITGTNYYIDNLKLYETDMIPFFQYFRNPLPGGGGGNINISVQIPNSTVILGPSPVTEVDDNDGVAQSYYTSLINNFLEIPTRINWDSDYIIYRTQDEDYEQLAGIYETDTISKIKSLNSQLLNTQTGTTTNNTNAGGTTTGGGTTGGGTTGGTTGGGTTTGGSTVGGGTFTGGINSGNSAPDANQGTGGNPNSNWKSQSQQT